MGDVAALAGYPADAPIASKTNPLFPSLILPPVKSGWKNPVWKDQDLARVRLSPKGDRRQTEIQHQLFSINEEGTIPAKAILGLGSQIAQQEIFKKIMSGGSAADTAQLYRDALPKAATRALSVAALNRILDHEAMKLMLQPEPSDRRVDYVMRSLFTEIAAMLGKVPTEVRKTKDACERERDRTVPVEHLARYSNQEMYGWLKEAVGEKPVTFNIDWTYAEGGMASELQALRLAEDEMTWSPIRLSFQKLPGAWREFREEIRRKMLPVHRTMTRQAVWRRLIMQQHPFMYWELLFSVNDGDMREIYEAVKGRLFKAQPRQAELFELVIKGERAAELKERFLAELSKAQAELVAKIEARIPKGQLPTPEQRAEVVAMIEQANRTVPREIFERLEHESLDPALARLEAEVPAGAAELPAGCAPEPIQVSGTGPLKAALLETPIEHDGVSAPPSNQSLNAHRHQLAFQAGNGLGIFPRVEAVESDGTIRVMLLKETRLGQVYTVPAEHPVVQAHLKSRVQSRKQGTVMREVAFRLFQSNPVEMLVSTCDDPDWSCPSTSARALAEAMFPEVLLDGESLGTDTPNLKPENKDKDRVVTSSLGRPELAGKVLEIGLDALNWVMGMENP